MVKVTVSFPLGPGTNVCVGFSTEDDVPSPNVQYHEAIGELESATERSTKLTVVPGHILYALGMKFACGFDITFTQIDVTPMQWLNVSASVMLPTVPGGEDQTTSILSP